MIEPTRELLLLTSGVWILLRGVVLGPVVRRPRGDDHGPPLVLEGAVEPPGVVAAVAARGHAAARGGAGVQKGLYLSNDGLSSVKRLPGFPVVTVLTGHPVPKL